MVKSTLGMIHNCAKAEVNCKLLRKYHFVEAAQPYTDPSENSESTVLQAVLAISYVMEEDELSIMRISQGTHRQYSLPIVTLFQTSKILYPILPTPKIKQKTILF